jgi:hypothetical protein
MNRMMAKVKGAAAVAIAAAFAAMLTHGLVVAGLDLSEERPVGTYRGFFQRTLWATEQIWSRCHGWPSERRRELAIRDAQDAYARAPEHLERFVYVEPVGGQKTMYFTAKGRDADQVYRQRMDSLSLDGYGSHIDQFGRFYARAVIFGCPLLGFAVHWLLAWRRMRWNLWTPLVLATVGAVSLYADSFSSAWLPWSQMAVAALTVVLMAWTSGLSRPSGSQRPA